MLTVRDFDLLLLFMRGVFPRTHPPEHLLCRFISAVIAPTAPASASQSTYCHYIEYGMKSAPITDSCRSGMVGLRRVRVRFMLREECESLRHRAQEHLGQLDPVRAAGGRQQRLQVAAPEVRGRPLVHFLRLLCQSQWHVAMQEGHPLQQEAPRIRHTLIV